MRNSFPPPLKARPNPLLWLLYPVIFLLGLGSGWLIWGHKSAVDPAQDSAVNINQNLKRTNVQVDDDPSIGPENAPITIVEFSDYQCPFCTKWHDEVFNQLMTDYKGTVRFVYRDFPLYSIHPQSQSAAEAADCAGEQGKYWQYHNALFSEKYSLGSDAYTRYAAEEGLNPEQFAQCMSDHRFKSEVDADFKYATTIGVSSTPTFFVNGLAVVGAQPYEVFKELIDKELAGEIPK